MDCESIVAWSTKTITREHYGNTRLEDSGQKESIEGEEEKQ